MKFKKGAVIAAVVVICILAAALFLQNGGKKDNAGTAAGESDTTVSANDNTSEAADTDPAASETNPETDTPQQTDTPADTAAVPSADGNAAGGSAAAASGSVPGAASDAAPASTPETATSPEDDKLTCTLTINCATILNNMDKLAKGKESLVPADGNLLSLTDVEFEEGDTVFDILQRELQNRNMHLEFSTSPIYGSAYVEGICNLYEFDCGELSGWEYSVNGKFQGCSCSEYTLSDGDVIAWVYTCDNGADVGNDF